jgi:hypothetical protein
MRILVVEDEKKVAKALRDSAVSSCDLYRTPGCCWKTVSRGRKSWAPILLRYKIDQGDLQLLIATTDSGDDFWAVVSVSG